MNNRIKELMSRCGIPIKYCKLDVCGNEYYIQNLEVENFAELLIKECMEICRDIFGEDTIDGRGARLDCACEIRDHFGVEE